MKGTRGGMIGKEAHVLLNVLLAGCYCTLTELHAEGSGGIVETPGREVNMGCGVNLTLEVRLMGWGLVLVGAGVRGGEVSWIRGIGWGLDITGSRRRAGVALVSLWRHGGRRGLWDVSGMSGDGVLEGRGAAAVGVVGHFRRICEGGVRDRRVQRRSRAGLAEESETGRRQREQWSVVVCAEDVEVTCARAVRWDHTRTNSAGGGLGAKKGHLKTAKFGYRIRPVPRHIPRLLLKTAVSAHPPCPPTLSPSQPPPL